MLQVAKGQMQDVDRPLTLAEAAARAEAVDWTALFRQYSFDDSSLLLPIEIYERQCWLWSHLMPLFARLVLDGRRDDALRIWRRMEFLVQCNRPFDPAIWASALYELSFSETSVVYRFLAAEGIGTGPRIVVPPEPRDNTDLILAALNVLVEREPTLLLQPLCRVSIQLWRLLPSHWPTLRSAELWVLWHKQRELQRLCPAVPKPTDYLRLVLDGGQTHMLAQFSIEEILSLDPLEGAQWWARFFSNLPPFSAGRTVPLELYLRHCENIPILFPMLTEAVLQGRTADALALWSRLQSVARSYNVFNDTLYPWAPPREVVPLALWQSHIESLCAADPAAGVRLYAFFRRQNSEILEPWQWTRFLGGWPLHPNAALRFPVLLYTSYCETLSVLFSLFTEAALEGRADEAHMIWTRILHLSTFQVTLWQLHLDKLYEEDPTACTRLYEFCLAQGINPLTPKQWRQLKASSACHLANSELTRLANRLAKTHRTRNRNR